MKEKNEIFLPEKDYGAQILGIIRGDYTDEEISEKLLAYHENDIAGIFQELTLKERERLFQVLGSEFMSEIVVFLEDAGDYLSQLDADEAGTHFCMVTFDGCRTEVSDEVEIGESDVDTTNKILEADISFRTDIAGLNVYDYEDYIEILTEGLQFEDDYGDPAVYVEDSDGEYFDGEFVSGETYTIFVYLSAESGYKLANTVDGTVNGEEVLTEVDGWVPGGIYGDVGVKYVEFEFEITVTDPCTHVCHRDGFMGFLWSIVNFFNRIFGLNPFCVCGAAHY